MADLIRRPVLVLNASYEPIHVCSAKRAVTLVLKGAAYAEEDTGLFLHTSARKVPLPSVVRLFSYRKLPRFKFTLSRKNILIRDKYTCQYCGQKFVPAKLTLDHIVPRSKGGSSAWDNLVASCKPCNNRKGDRSPEEANMPLMFRPREASCFTRHQLLRTSAEQITSWQKYLFF